MKDSPASRPSRTRRPWAMWLACALAVAAAGLLALADLADLAGIVMGSWDIPAPGLGWLKPGAIGQLGLAAAAVAVLAGAARPRGGAAPQCWQLRSSRWRPAGAC